MKRVVAASEIFGPPGRSLGLLNDFVSRDSGEALSCGAVGTVSFLIVYHVDFGDGVVHSIPSAWTECSARAAELLVRLRLLLEELAQRAEEPNESAA